MNTIIYVLQDFVLVLIVQSLFMFFIDHKYRLLNNNSVEKIMLFQGIIATMYVFIIPMIAKGDILASIGYILGSVIGTYISYKIHNKDN